MGSFRPIAIMLLVFWLLVLVLAGARAFTAESPGPCNGKEGPAAAC